MTYLRFAVLTCALLGCLSSGVMNAQLLGGGNEPDRVSTTATLKDIQQMGEAGLGDPANRYLFAMESFKGHLYVGTLNATYPGYGIFRFGAAKPLAGNGTQLYRLDNEDSLTPSWSLMVGGGNGNIANLGIRCLKSITLSSGENYLFAVTVNHTNGMEVWRSLDGVKWDVVSKGGFGNIHNSSGRGIEYFNGYIYATTENRIEGAEIWRSATGEAGTWEPVVKKGLGNSKNYWFSDFVLFQGKLFVGVMNNYDGMALYYTEDGVTFKPAFERAMVMDLNGDAKTDSVADSSRIMRFVWKCIGFADVFELLKPYNEEQHAVMKLTVFNNNLFFSTMNWHRGFSVYKSHDGIKFDEVMTRGENSIYNTYTWNMTVFNGRIYAGTFQRSFGRPLRYGMFSLFSSETGDKGTWAVETDRAFANPSKFWYFSPNMGDYGIRTLKTHNGKLYIGTATAWNSCKVYRADFRTEADIKNDEARKAIVNPENIFSDMTEQDIWDDLNFYDRDDEMSSVVANPKKVGTDITEQDILNDLNFYDQN